MKKIIPFKKDLNFKTKISEITSISLEHKIINTTDELVSGEFYISGDYKITEGNINREKFEFVLPFDIALNERFELENLVVDIDDFRYDVKEDILKINIDVSLEGDEKIIEIKKEEIEEPKEELLEDEKEEDRNKEPEEIIENINNKEEVEEPVESGIPKINIFDNLETSETYSTYKVYIVKQEDNIETILTKYNISKENLEEYNDLSNINAGDKIIIPSIK